MGETTHTDGGPLRGNPGFTLLELLTAMVIAGVVMGSVYSAYLSQNKAYQTQENVAAVQQNLRAALYFMEREIRMAGYDPQENTAAGITGPLSNPQDSIQFTFDRNKNGVIAGNDETVEYQYDPADGEIERVLGGGASVQPIAEHITGMEFTFTTASGVSTTAIDQVRFVNLTISGSKGSHQRTVSSRIACRNLGL